MSVWSIHQAKAQFAELIRQAQQQPQVLSSHGKRVAMIVSTADYEQLMQPQPSLYALMQASPLAQHPAEGDELEFERDLDYGRDVEL